MLHTSHTCFSISWAARIVVHWKWGLLNFGNVGSPVLFSPHPFSLYVCVSFYVTTHPSDPGFAGYALFRLTIYWRLLRGLRPIVFFFLLRSPFLRYPLLSSVNTDFRVRFCTFKSPMAVNNKKQRCDSIRAPTPPPLNFKRLFFLMHLSKHHPRVTHKAVNAKLSEFS